MPAYPIKGRKDCPTCAAQRRDDNLDAGLPPYPIAGSYRDPVREAAKQASKDRQRERG